MIYHFRQVIICGEMYYLHVYGMWGCMGVCGVFLFFSLIFVKNISERRQHFETETLFNVGLLMKKPWCLGNKPKNSMKKYDFICTKVELKMVMKCLLFNKSIKWT